MNGNQSESPTERIKGTQTLRNKFDSANLHQLGYENDDKPYRPSSSYLDKKFKINVDVKEYPEVSTSKPDLGDTQCNTFNSLSDSVTKKYQFNCRLPVENEKRSRRFFKEKPPIKTSIGSDIDIPLIDEVIKKISHSTKNANTFRHSSKCELRTYSNRRKVPLNIPDKPILESFGLPDESIIQVNDSLSALDLPIDVNLCSTQILDSSWSQNFSNSEVVNIEHFDLPSVIFKSRLTSSDLGTLLVPETESEEPVSFRNGSVAKSNFGRLKKSSSQLKDVSDEEEKFQTTGQKKKLKKIKTGNFESNLGSNDRNDERLYSSLVMSKKEKGQNDSQSLNRSKGRKNKSSSKISIESNEGKTDMVNPNVSKRLELKILLNPLIITDYVDKSIKCNINNIHQDIGTSNQSLHKRGNNTFQRGLRSKSTTLGNSSDKSTNKEVPSHKKHANGKLPKLVKDDLESAFYSSQSFDLNKKKTLKNAKESNKSNLERITSLPTCTKIPVSNAELDQKQSLMKINERIGVSSNTRRVSPRHLPINFNATWPVNSLTMKNRIKKNFSNIVRKPSTALQTIEEIQVSRYSQDDKSFSSADADYEKNTKRSSRAVKSMPIESPVNEKLTNRVSTKDGSSETVISKINTDFGNRLVQIKLRKCDDISSPLFKKFSDLDCSPLRRSPRNSIQLDHKAKLVTTETTISDIEDSGNTSANENRHSTVEKTIKIQNVRERDSQICLGVERIDQREGIPRRSPRNSLKNGELPTTLLTKNSIADKIEDISSEDNERSIISEVLEKNSVRRKSQKDTSKFNLLRSYPEVVSQKCHEPFKSDSGDKETLIEVKDQSKSELFPLEKDKFGRSMEDKNHLDPLRRSLRRIPKSFNKIEDGMENVDNKEHPVDNGLNSIQIKKKLEPDEFVENKSKTILFQALMKEISHVAIPPLNESQTEQAAEQISPQFKSINIRHSGRKITLINNKTGFKSEAKEFKIEQNETLPTDTLMKFDQQIQQNGMIEFSLVKKSGMETNSPADFSSSLSTFEDCDTSLKDTPNSVNFPEKNLSDCDKEKHFSFPEIERSRCDNYMETDPVQQHEGDIQIVKKITSDFVERFDTLEDSLHEENEQIVVINDSLRRSQRLSYGRLDKKKVESTLLNNSKTALLANGDINKHKRKSVLNPPKDETVFSTQKNGQLSNVSSKEISRVAKNDVASLNPVKTASRNESSELEDTLETKKSILDLEQNVILDNVSTIILKTTEDEISSPKIASLNKQNSKCPKGVLKKRISSDIGLESFGIDSNVGSLVFPKKVFEYKKNEDNVLELDPIGKGDKETIKKCNRDKSEASVSSSNLQSHSKEHLSSQIVSLNSKQKCPKSILKKRVSSDISIESTDIETNVGSLASPKKVDRNLESSGNLKEDLIEKNDKEMIKKLNREKSEASVGSSNVQSHSKERVSSQIVSLNKENSKQKCSKSILKKRVSSDISVESIDIETNVESFASPKKVDRNLESSRNEEFEKNDKELIKKFNREKSEVSARSSNVQSHSKEHASSQIVSSNKENSKQKCPKSILKKRVSSDISVESIDIETNVGSLASPKKIDRNLESSRNEDFVLEQEHLIEKNDKEMIKKCNREKLEVSARSSNVQSHSKEHESSQIVSLNKENSKQKCPKSILKKRISSDISVESIDIETNVESFASPKKVDGNLESSRNEDFALIEKNDKEMIKKFNREKSEVSVCSSNVQSHSTEQVSSQIVSLNKEDSKQKCPRSILKKRISSDISVESIDIETNVGSLASPKKVDRNLESSRNENFVLEQEHLIEINDKEVKKFNREKSEVSVGSSNVQSHSDKRSQEIGIFNNFVLTENEVSPIKKLSKFLPKIHPYDEAGETRRKSLRSRVPRSKSLTIRKEGSFEDNTFKSNKVVKARIFNSSVDDKMLISDNDGDSKRLRSKSECRSALRINVNDLCRTRRSRSRKRRPLKIMNSANVNSDEIEKNYIKNDDISDEKTQSFSEVSASNVKIEENVDSSSQSQGDDTIIERNRKRSKSANSGLKILRRSSRFDRKVDPIQQQADSKPRRNKKKEENLQDLNGDVSNDLCESNEELEVIPIHILTGVSLNDELIPSSFEHPETVTAALVRLSDIEADDGLIKEDFMSISSEVLQGSNISGEEALNASTEKMVEVEVIFDEVPKNFADVRYTDSEIIVLPDHVLDNLATEHLNEKEIELKCEPNTVKGDEHTPSTNQTVDDNAIEISNLPITPSPSPGIEYDSFEDHSNSVKKSKPRPKSVVPFVTDSSCGRQNFSEENSGKPEENCPSYLKEYLDVGYDIHRRRSFRKILQNVIEISKIEMQFNEIEARKKRSKSVPHERQREMKRTFTISEASDVWKKPRKNKTSPRSEGKKSTPTSKEKSRISLVGRTNLKKTQLFKDDVTIQKPHEIANTVYKIDELIFESPHKAENASSLIGSELGKVTRSKSKLMSANWKVQSMQESDQKPCVLDSLDSNFARKTMSPCDLNEAASDIPTISSDLGQSVQKESTTAKMIKAQRFPGIDSEGKPDFKVGDLVWGKIGRNPYWPCLVVREPGSKLYKKITDMWRNCFTLYHVRFFGDKGRRAWTKHLIPYTSRNDLNALSTKAVLENSSSKTSIQENYHIKQALTNKWQKAIEEADSLLSKTIKDKLKFFFNMFANADEKNRRRVRRKLKIASDEDGQNELKPGRLNETKQEPGLISTKRKRHSQEILLEAKRSKTDDVILGKRNDLSPQRSKTDAKLSPKKVKSQSPNVKPVKLFSPKKLRSKSITPLDCHLSDTDSKISGNSSSQASLESQAALYRRNNIFKGVLRDKVCQFCEKPEDILKCRGPCIGNYHLKCAEKLLKQFQHGKREIVEEVTKEQTIGIRDDDKTLFDESTKEPTFDSKEPNVQIITIRSKLTPPPFSLALSPNIKKMSISEQIDRKMKEIMNQIDTEHSYPEPTDSSSDETPYDDAEAKIEKIAPQELRELMSKPMVGKVANDETKTSKKAKKSTLKQGATNVFKHVTADDVSIVNITSAGKLADTAGANTSSKSTDVVLSEEHFKCAFCTMSTEPYCFVCKQETSKKGNNARQKCSLFKCGRYYHLECLKTWPQTQWSFVLNPKVKVNNALDSFVCPVHVCHMCASEDPGISLGHCSNDKLVKCLRCPATYHNTSYCVPAGTEIITSTQIICPRHVSKKQFTLNTIWCFICSEGGNLICCENCPTSVHVECLPTNPSAEDVFICDDCETGRYPLYDEIVWVKLGNYRWWPALVLFPNEVPDNVRNKAHGRGEFVVKFFGTYDYHWVGRGRSFLYQEGDKGHLTNCKSKIDSAFAKAIDEAAFAHRLKTEFKVTKESKINNGLKPPPYVRIKVNRPVGNVRMFDGNLSNTTSCDCDPKQPNPCGPDSDCLNRLLLTECNPEVCSAKKNCLNQSFEKREYPPLLPYKTQSRGWGLKTLAPIKKGQFVIEYVGEMIDDDEYQRRILKMHQQKDENYYFLTIDKDRMLDAGPKGNVARFMNHSCQPNCETQKWTVNGDTRVGLFATDDIATDAELTFNYNLECVGKEKKICKCGAANCSGFIGAKPEGASKKSRSSVPKTKKKKESEGSGVEVIRNVPCFVCGKFTGVGACNNKNCNNYYHLKCVGLDSWPDGSKWTCSWHNCNICTKRTIRCCTKCTNSYCPSHSEGYIRYDNLLGFICTIHDETKTTRRRLKKKATLKYGTSSVNKNLKVSSREFRIDCKNTSTPMKKNVPLQVKTSSGPIRTSPQKKSSSLAIKTSPIKTKSRLLNVSEDSTASSGSRKRGRPRKVISNPNLNVSIESTSSDPVKRGRGRPKKVNLNYSKESSDFGSVKRKRGRPRKLSCSTLNDSTETLPSDVKIIDQRKPTSGTMDESIDLVTSESRTGYPVEFDIELKEISTDSKEDESCKRIKLDENVNGIGIVGLSDVAKELIVSHLNCEGVSRLNGKLETEEITESKIGTQKS